MRAAVFRGARDVVVETVPDPSPQPDGVVLEVLRAAICGTDAAEWDHGPVLCRPGVVLGHEFVGCVVATGSDVTQLRAGDRVVSGAGISCGRCRWCLEGRTNLCSEYRSLGLQVDGGLAEYVASPAGICRPVPPGCTDDAAAMAQPLAVALHALARAAPRGDEDVAILGAGGIGSFVVAGAAQNAAGGRVVAIDIDPARLATAAALGAAETADASGHDLVDLLLGLSGGVGFDVVIEATGAAHAPAAAIAGARRGGRVLLVGMHGAPREIDLTGMILREVDVLTTVAHVCDTDLPAALRLLASSDVAQVVAGPLIPLASLVEDGLRPLAERRAGGKILVDPHG